MKELWEEICELQKKKLSKIESERFQLLAAAFVLSENAGHCLSKRVLDSSFNHLWKLSLKPTFNQGSIPFFDNPKAEFRNYFGTLHLASASVRIVSAVELRAGKKKYSHDLTKALKKIESGQALKPFEKFAILKAHRHEIAHSEDPDPEHSSLDRKKYREVSLGMVLDLQFDVIAEEIKKLTEENLSIRENNAY